MQNISQKSFHSLNDAELLKLTFIAAKTEKAATLALLDYLVEVDARRLYAVVNACSSLFDYLVKELGFSHPAASERVNTVRLIRAVPPVKDYLEMGKLTLTSAAQIQRFVNAEQKVDPKGRAVSSSEKEKVIEACLGKSKREVEKTLFEKQSEPARILTQEKVRIVSANRSEIKFTVSENTIEKLKQLKDLVGNQSIEKIFDQGLDALLVAEKRKRGVVPKHSPVVEVKIKPQRKNLAQKMSANQAVPGRPADSAAPGRPADSAAPGRPADSAGQEAATHTPTTNPTAAPITSAHTTSAQVAKTETHAQLNSRFIPIELKRFVFARSKGQCEFVDPRTKTRCHSTFRLQIDHRMPLALGGQTTFSNLRHLCSAHNLRMAAQVGLHMPQSWVNHRLGDLQSR